MFKRFEYRGADLNSPEGGLSGVDPDCNVAALERDPIGLNGSMEIRLLGRGDEALARGVVTRFKRSDSPDPREFLDDPRTLLFVVEDGNAVAGWLYAYELVRPDGRRASLLYEVEVAEEARGRGYGRAMIDALLAEARSRGHFETWVLAEPDNEAAEALYSATAGRGTPQVMFTWDLT